MSGTRGSEGRRRARPAFTFIELVITLAIMATLSAIAAPRYANFLSHHRMQSATRRVMSDLSLAARRAKLIGENQTVAFNVAEDTYTVGDMMDPDHADLPYVTRISEPPYRATIVSADFGGDADLVFDGYGVPNANGSIVIRVGRFQQTIPVTGAAGAAGDGGIVVDPRVLPEPIYLTE